jgi:hypothetical protein
MGAKQNGNAGVELESAPALGQHGVRDSPRLLGTKLVNEQRKFASHYRG